MPAPLSGRGRLLRVAGFGGSSLTLALTAHLAGGGALPSPGVLAITAVLLGLVAVGLTRRRVHGPVLLIALAVEQLALHVIFDLASAPLRWGCGDAMAQMAHHACGVNGAGPAMQMAASHGSSPGSGAAMLIGHVLATLATAWLLTRGEAVLWRSADQLRSALVGPGARPRLRRPRPTSARPNAVIVTRTERTRPPRGPPRPVGATA